MKPASIAALSAAVSGVPGAVDSAGHHPEGTGACGDADGSQWVDGLVPRSGPFRMSDIGASFGTDWGSLIWPHGR